jgi:hypothetical protein
MKSEKTNDVMQVAMKKNKETINQTNNNSTNNKIT